VNGFGEVWLAKKTQKQFVSPEVLAGFWYCLSNRSLLCSTACIVTKV